MGSTLLGTPLVTPGVAAVVLGTMVGVGGLGVGEGGCRPLLVAVEPPLGFLLVGPVGPADGPPFFEEELARDDERVLVIV